MINVIKCFLGLGEAGRSRLDTVDLPCINSCWEDDIALLARSDSSETKYEDRSVQQRNVQLQLCYIQLHIIKTYRGVRTVTLLFQVWLLIILVNGVLHSYSKSLRCSRLCRNPVYNQALILAFMLLYVRRLPII